MASKQKNPATRAAGRVQEKIVCLAAAINPDNSRLPLETQRLRVISRRVAMPAHLAEIVASLCFGEVRT